MSTTIEKPQGKGQWDDPTHLKQNITGRVLYQKIWKRCNRENKHFMGAIVGREGMGKSYTALKIGELVDPGFHAGRVMFDPADFLERLRSEDTGPGDVVILDEAGVGVGNRSWYEKDQIMLNQTLQVVRDENMAAIFTLPRLSELDSQTRGRLSAFVEMVELNEEEGYARAKWKNVDPTRDERDKLYKKYPRMRVNGRKRRIRSVAFTPPSEDLATAYEQRKAEFKASLYEDTINALRGEDGDGEDGDLSPKDVAAKLKEDGLEDVVSEHGVTGEPYVDADLVQLEYDLSVRDAKKVKKLLERDDEVVLE